MQRLHRFFAVAALTALAACSADESPTAVELAQADVAASRSDSQNGQDKQDERTTIADIAIGFANADEPEFTVLVAALQAADLVDALDGKGQFTVFAPTDAAFGRLLELLETDAETLLADTELLTEVLLYHVARGRRLSDDVLDSDRIRTLQGGFLFPTATDEGAFIRDTEADTEDAQLLAPDLIDVEASNGVIHVIDEVLLFGDEPPVTEDDDDDDDYDDEDEDDDEGDDDDEDDDDGDDDELDVTIAGLVESLATADEPEFTILKAALEAANLVDALDGDREFTVFAPTDAAFAELLELLDTDAETLLADTELLTTVLLYHVAPGDRDSEDVLESDRIRTLQGQFLRPSVTDEGAFIVDGNDATRDAQLQAPDLIDIFVSNGVVHVIDAVLLPALD